MSPWLTCVIFWKLYDIFESGGVLTFAGIIGIVMIWLYYRLCLLVSDGNQQISRILAFFAGFVVCRYGWIDTVTIAACHQPSRNAMAYTCRNLRIPTPKITDTANGVKRILLLLGFIVFWSAGRCAYGIFIVGAVVFI